MGKFTDQADIAPYAVPFVDWAVEQGLFKGDDKGNFKPKGYVTREDFCVILKRFHDAFVKGGTTTPPTQPETPKPTDPVTPPTKTPKTKAELEKIAKAGSMHVNLGGGGTASLLKDGYVLTARHVGSGRAKIPLRTNNRDNLEAVLVADHPNPKIDISLYKLTTTAPSTLVPMTLSQNPPVRDESVMCVDAEYLEQIVRNGIVAQVPSSDEWKFSASLAVDSGNSGAGILNQYGEIIGVVTNRYSVMVTVGSVKQQVQACEANIAVYPEIKNWLKTYNLV